MTEFSGWGCRGEPRAEWPVNMLGDGEYTAATLGGCKKVYEVSTSKSTTPAEHEQLIRLYTAGDKTAVTVTHIT